MSGVSCVDPCCSYVCVTWEVIIGSYQSVKSMCIIWMNTEYLIMGILIGALQIKQYWSITNKILRIQCSDD